MSFSCVSETACKAQTASISCNKCTNISAIISSTRQIPHTPPCSFSSFCKCNVNNYLALVLKRSAAELAWLNKHASEMKQKLKNPVHFAIRQTITQCNIKINKTSKSVFANEILLNTKINLNLIQKRYQYCLFTTRRIPTFLSTTSAYFQKNLLLYHRRSFTTTAFIKLVKTTHNSQKNKSSNMVVNSCQTCRCMPQVL